LFLSESRRKPWPAANTVDLVEGGAPDRRWPPGVERFSTHTTRHLCLTDLARMGWELHAIATFAGHRSTESTLQYIHLSGRDLAEKLQRGMHHIHAWRVEMLAGLGEPGPGSEPAVTVLSSAAANATAAAPAWPWPIDQRRYDCSASTHRR